MRATILRNLRQAAEATLRQSFDPQHGGFGPAPKFPQPLALRWLLGRWRRSGDGELLHIVATTLDHMAAGGLFDQLGGGFHRYSVDARWLAPHFEKMLYDNALLAVCYLEAWQATREDQYAAVARQTLDYLLRDMTDSQGGFYSSEDADSEGEEGKFYLWTPGEIEAVLGPESARVFCRVYDVTEAGNFEGRNILHLSRPLEIEAKMLGREPAATGGRIGGCPAAAAGGSGQSRPAGPRRESAGELEQPGHRRLGPSRGGVSPTALHGGGRRRGRLPPGPSPPQRQAIAPLLARRPGQVRRLS